MTFEELRSGVDIVSLMRYTSTFGTKHLFHLAFADKATEIQRYDVDILFGLFMLLFTLYKVMSLIIKN